MKKTLFSIGLVMTSAFYMIFVSQSSTLITPQMNSPILAQNTPSLATSGTQIATNPPALPANVPTSTPTTTTTTPTPSPKPKPTPAPTPKPIGMYKDGTYTGSSADAYYGNVQVRAVIQGGKIANVKFLDYPQSHQTSVYINSQAMPYLTQEAIQAQSANVNIVSGATDTSMAFQQSLASALTQAKN